jgi:hypothetical protein
MTRHTASIRLHRVMLALLIGFVPLATSAQIRLGPELQVNTYATGQQTFPSVSWQPGGGFVVVWNSEPESPAASGIFAQRFDASGARLGEELEVKPATTIASSANGAIASDTSGGFVVLWSTHWADGSYRGVFGRRYDSSGVAQATEFGVNTYTTFDQLGPAVAPGLDGSFTVAWESHLQDGSGWAIVGRRYDGSGGALGDEFRVNTHTTHYQFMPAITSDAAGNFVVVWCSEWQDGSTGGIFGQRFDASGAHVGGEFQVNTFTPRSQELPSVASDGDGRFLVAWRSDDGNFDDGVFARRFDASGQPMGSDFQVNTYTTGDQSLNGVAADDRGNFVVVWSSEGALDGGGHAVMARLYDSSGRPHSGEFVVNAYRTASQTYPAVAFAPDGRFVVTWHDNGGQDGHGHGIFAQVFAQDLVFRDGFE